MGVGFNVEVDGMEIYSHSCNCGEGTVSKGEWAGLIQALFWLRGHQGFTLNGDKVVIYMDSQYVVNTINGIYNSRKESLVPFYRLALKLLNSFPVNTVEVEWIPRELNVRADKLSKEGLMKEINKPAWWTW